ncbi:MAG: hypothetical protein V4613_06605, partial [Bacteroidota bacterium]
MKSKKRLSVQYILVMLMLLFANAASAQTTPTLNSIGLPFNIDGYVVRQSSAYGDWARGTQTTGTDSAYLFFNSGAPKNIPLTFHTRDVFGSGDDVFDGGNKTNANPSNWGWKYGTVPNKDDMHNVGVHFSEASTGDMWAVLAGDRYTVNGTSYIDFEFLQNTLSATPPSGSTKGSISSAGPNCGRTVGDILVTVEYTNGGSVDSIYYYRWAAASGGCSYNWVSFTVAGGTSFGFSNDTTIAVPYGAFGNSYYVTKQFVEIGINITAIIDGSIDNDPCTGLAFKTLFVKTKASASPTADLKDLIQPYQLNLNLGVADIIYAGPFCAGAGNKSVSKSGPSSTNSGTYTISPTSSGVTINSSTGEVNIGSSASGTYQVIYTYTPRTNCTKADTTTFVVSPVATANANSDQTVCSTSPNVTLAGSVGGSSTTGTWSGGTGTYNPNATTLNAVYTPSAAEITAGTVTLTLTSNDPVGPCTSATDQMTITITPNSTANAGTDIAQCANATFNLAGNAA